MPRRLHPLVFAMALTGLPGAASAGLIGSNVTLGYTYQSNIWAETTAVTAGIEATCPGSHAVCNALAFATQTVDIGDSDLTYAYSGASTLSFNDVVPSFLFIDDLPGDFVISGVSLTTDIAGLDSSRLSFSAGRLEVALQGLNLGANAFFRIEMQTASVVPAPPSLPLAAAALAAALLARRCRPAAGR